MTGFCSPSANRKDGSSSSSADDASALEAACLEGPFAVAGGSKAPSRKRDSYCELLTVSQMQSRPSEVGRRHVTLPDFRPLDALQSRGQETVRRCNFSNQCARFRIRKARLRGHEKFGGA